MTRWGQLLMVLGLISFILPIFGIQFRLVNLFGGSPAAGIFISIIGGILWGIGAAMEKNSSAATQTQTAQPEQFQSQPVQARLVQSHPPIQSYPPIQAQTFHPVQAAAPMATVPLPATVSTKRLGQACTQCSHALPAGAGFCGECGAPVVAAPVAAVPVARHCPACGHAVALGKNFCTGCGARMT